MVPSLVHLHGEISRTLQIAVMGGLSGCQNGGSDGPISPDCIEKAIRSLEDAKQRVRLSANSTQRRVYFSVKHPF